MRHTFLALLFLLVLSPAARADEGMWLPYALGPQLVSTMQAMGLQLTPEQIYSTDQPSLKDAVVMFGGYCSGVVVSTDGLVLTNHHCGLGAVQELSTPEHDYAYNGFYAPSLEEELPCLDMFIRFMESSSDVSDRILPALTSELTLDEREAVADSVEIVLQQELAERDSTLVGRLSTFNGGRVYYFNTYRDFEDIRLVMTPPQSFGKFGGDTDNWVWPRHTADFCVFRIYADADNQPAPYSEDNQPYHPPYVVPINLDGYQEGDFCLTMGYPGGTNRNMSSYGLETEMVDNEVTIDIYNIKQDIWREAMSQNDTIRLQYTSKYASNANVLKSSIGANRSLRELQVVERRRAIEATLAAQDPDFEATLAVVRQLTPICQTRQTAILYLIGGLLRGSDLMSTTFEIINFEPGENFTETLRAVKNIMQGYHDMDIDTDRRLFTDLLRLFRQKVDTRYWPEVIAVIDSYFGGSEECFADSLYARTAFGTPVGFYDMLDPENENTMFDDPGVMFCLDVLGKAYDIMQDFNELRTKLREAEAKVDYALSQAYAHEYPDADFTMRLSFGSVSGYQSPEGIHYDYFTTTKGIREKAVLHAGDPDFNILPADLDLLDQAAQSPYADNDGELHACFITTNDISGGNSGSAIFNAQGELLGLAFDGNWEAMSSDYAYEPDYQRCIGVDIRYVLFCLDRWAGAERILAELGVNPGE